MPGLWHLCCVSVCYRVRQPRLHSSCCFGFADVAAAAGPQPGDAAGPAERGEDLDFDGWQALQLPMALCTACAACGAGVRPPHVLQSVGSRGRKGLPTLPACAVCADLSAAACRRQAVRLAHLACRAVLTRRCAAASQVRRAHLVDASVDGGLLLELYSREGAPHAAMISSDFYQVAGGPRPCCRPTLLMLDGRSLRIGCTVSH